MLKTTNERTAGQKGFTIIEVLIVLAIAGLILLIVFLAVPALQRNARNTAIKNDAASLAGGFAEYSANNDGASPVAPLAQNGSAITIGVGTTVSKATAKVGASTVVTPGKSTPTAFQAGTLYWNTGKDCAGQASPRALSVYYYVESTTPSGVPKCVEGK